MGQMVYDNLFWNKTVKDLGMISVRSLGWNIGTVRELGGGFKDFAQQAANVAAGQSRKRPLESTMQSPCRLWWLGLALWRCTSLLVTHKRTEDYFYPQNGKNDQDGNPARWALPTYVKDVVGFSHAPVQTVMNKFHPIFHAMAEMICQQKIFTAIKFATKDDPAVVQVKDIVEYIAKTFIPFRRAKCRAVGKRARRGNRNWSLLPTTGEKAARFLVFFQRQAT